ncbi:alpha-L-fucosidase [Allomuricauda sp. F6463D]|uniref:alpha-L-fucosidase n=1 Tax=Allomuricauda sp. F6463D TaxID=2926409 RepID=UPI001FF301AB|nr:alpha-L-fucosidase [Muricauda sp. F6463D]MCK0160532.1 alpha-L-fucosidase [Muricauda sp. F6463D]
MINYLSKMFFCGILTLGFLCGCKQQSKLAVQDAKFWVVLDAADAIDTADQLSWEFQLNRPGVYNLQILRDGEQQSPLGEIAISSADVQLEEAPPTTFIIEEADEKKTVSQLNATIKYNKAGLQTLTLNIDSGIDKIRITPLYSRNLGFGTDQYYEEWLQMHQSSEKQAALEWFKESKYGMFIHWGLYSQAGGVWKGERMEDSKNPGPTVSEWLMHKFQIPRNEYAQLAQTFNPDTSFAQNIAKLAKNAGMKYVVITTKHHDGFALFDSECSTYDMVDATPYKSDVIKELYDACLAEGLAFSVYYSHGNDWYDGTDGNYANVKKHNDSFGIRTHATGKNLWDPSPNYHASYIENKAIPQVKELLDLLPELRLFWFDGDGFITEAQAFDFYKLIYDTNPNILVNRRVGFDFGDYLDAGDNKIPSVSDQLTKYFETCGTTNNSWAYKSYDDDWKSTQEILYYLVDIASKGGNYLLNIGPDGTGRVPKESAIRLREIGNWLSINGKAIYGTTRWEITKEGKEETLLDGTQDRAEKGFNRTFTRNDFWFTSLANRVYAISLVKADGPIKIKSLALSRGKIKKVTLLGSSAQIDWKQNDQGLEVNLNELPLGNYGYALEVTF